MGAAALASVLVAAHFALLDGLDGLVFRALVGSEDTVYATGYSHSSFRTIRNGLPQSDVLALLGKPLEQFAMQEDSAADDGWWYRRPNADAEGWSYSQSKNSSHYRKRIIVFRDGQVVDTIAKFYVD